ncbi:MAG: hypothetical protein INR62_10615, partial [Rhodospirillales bacterium]|nr:hypothetical protein [Acetobacter sp.]
MPIPIPSAVGHSVDQACARLPKSTKHQPNWFPTRARVVVPALLAIFRELIERLKLCASPFRVTNKQWAILMAAVSFIGEDGTATPTLAQIADRARARYREDADRRTVQRALARFRDLGFVRWQAEIELRLWREGGRGALRAEQTSNRYEFLIPDMPNIPPPKRPMPRPNGYLRAELQRERESRIAETAARRAIEAERERLRAELMAEPAVNCGRHAATVNLSKQISSPPYPPRSNLLVARRLQIEAQQCQVEAEKAVRWERATHAGAPASPQPPTRAAGQGTRA